MKIHRQERAPRPIRSALAILGFIDQHVDTPPSSLKRTAGAQALSTSDRAPAGSGRHPAYTRRSDAFAAPYRLMSAVPIRRIASVASTVRIALHLSRTSRIRLASCSKTSTISDIVLTAPLLARLARIVPLAVRLRHRIGFEISDTSFSVASQPCRYNICFFLYPAFPPTDSAVAAPRNLMSSIAVSIAALCNRASTVSSAATSNKALVARTAPLGPS